jgi:hypothetical protein
MLSVTLLKLWTADLITQPDATYTSTNQTLASIFPVCTFALQVMEPGNAVSHTAETLDRNFNPPACYNVHLESTKPSALVTRLCTYYLQVMEPGDAVSYTAKTIDGISHPPACYNVHHDQQNYCIHNSFVYVCPAGDGAWQCCQPDSVGYTAKTLDRIFNPPACYNVHFESTKPSALVTPLCTYPLQVMEPGDAVSYTAGTREASLHALAGRHPNIVPLLDAFEHRTAAGRHACMVLERQGSPLDYVSDI